LLPILRSYINKKYKKKYWKNIYIYYEKSIPECLENHWRLVEKDQIYKIEKVDNVFLTDEGLIGKENLI
jgi:CTP:phosphocholine cytidylyltransferase-like protein